MERITEPVKSELKKLFENVDVGGHDLNHMLLVTDHSIKALKYENLPDFIEIKIVLASLLHDADDSKIFKNLPFEYYNTKNILNDSLEENSLVEYMDSELNNMQNEFIMTYRFNSGNLIEYKKKFINDIISLIDIVSCSKNGDKDPKYKWMAIPRDCDRLEAIGSIGIQRCAEYAKTIGRPVFTPETEKACSEDELWKIAIPERFNNYTKNKTSISTIDHYYDKLLHIGDPHRLKSQNKYILDEASTRRNIMINFVLDFWRNN